MTADVGELPGELVRAIASLGGRKLVLVEGESDRDVLYRWFLERAADIVFYSVSGVEGVLDLTKRIQASRPDVQVFGIRDRDFIGEAEVDVTWTAYSPAIFIWRRYCIENYLLEPAALFPEIETFLAAACPIADVSQMEAKLLELCRALHHMMAANWLLLESGLSSYSDGHHLLSREAFVTEISQKLNITPDKAEAILMEKERILAPSLASLETAHHVTNGKHLLHQVYDLIAAVQRGLRKDHLFRLLRNRIKESVGIHADVREIVERRFLGDAT